MLIAYTELSRQFNGWHHEYIVQFENVVPNPSESVIVSQEHVSLIKFNRVIRLGNIVLIKHFYPYQIIGINNIKIDTLNVSFKLTMQAIPLLDKATFNHIMATEQARKLGWKIK